MWWSERTGRRVLRPLAAGALCLALGACGFQRQYAARGTEGSPIREEMSHIEIAPIPERTGQLLRNMLLTEFTPLGEPSRPAYRLEVKLSERLDGVTLSRQKTTTRYNYWLNAAFRLRDARTDKVLLADEARALTAFNLAPSEFATTVAADDARRRAAELVGGEIEGRLSAYFSRRQASR